jgi:LysM repeat protein
MTARRRRGTGATAVLVLSVVAMFGCGSDDDSSSSSTTAPLAPLTAVPTTTVAPTTTLAQIYVIQEGDTLSGVAAKFDVSLELLIAFNEITDPNAIQLGQQLVIPPAATDDGAGATTTDSANGSAQP